MHNGKNGSTYHDPSVESYLREIKDGRRYPILPREEQAELMIKARRGSLKAVHRLVFSNLRLVVAIADECYRRGFNLTFAELIGYGNEGLIDAALTCDRKKSDNFTTYANKCIRNALNTANAEEGTTVRRPWNHYTDLPKIREMIDYHYVGTGQRLSLDVVANRLKITAGQAERCIQTGTPILSLDEQEYDDKSLTSLDLLKGNLESPLDHLQRQDLEGIVKSALKVLKRDERLVVKLRFGIGREYVAATKKYKPKDGEDGLTFEQIAKFLHMTRQNAQVIWKNARRKMKGHLTVERLKSAYEERII